jgi:hypothetical protein
MTWYLINAVWRNVGGLILGLLLLALGFSAGFNYGQVPRQYRIEGSCGDPLLDFGDDAPNKAASGGARGAWRLGEPPERG